MQHLELHFILIHWYLLNRKTKSADLDPITYDPNRKPFITFACQSLAVTPYFF